MSSLKTVREKALLLILPIISGLLLSLTLPTFEITFLIWFALIPFLYFLDYKSLDGKTLIIGCFFGGLIYVLFVIWPLTSVNSWWVKNPDPHSFLWIHKELLLKIFIVFFSFYSGSLTFLLFGWLYRKITSGGLIDVITVSILWVVTEIVREFLVLGFSWGQLGYALHDNLLILQIASFSGVYGLSFFIVIVNTLLYLWIKKIIEAVENKSSQQKTKGVLELVINRFSLILLTILIVTISFSMARIEKDRKENEKISVAVIHPALTTEKSATLEGHNLYLSLIGEALENNPDLVVTPENSLPWIIVDEEKKLPLGYSSANPLRRDIFDKLISLSKQNPKAILSLGVHTIKNNERFNSLLAFENGELISIYNKRKLLPMFERSPEFIKQKHAAPISSISDGKSYIENREKSLKIDTLICSEVNFTRLTEQKEASLIVNVSNDSIFDSLTVAKQHHIMAKLRAVENKKSVLRSVKGGVSSIIDSYGRVLKKSGGDKAQIIFGEVEI